MQASYIVHEWSDIRDKRLKKLKNWTSEMIDLVYFKQ